MSIQLEAHSISVHLVVFSTKLYEVSESIYKFFVVHCHLAYVYCDESNFLPTLFEWTM